MDEEEKRRYDRLKLEAPRILHVCARVLTRVVLGNLLDSDPSAVRFDRSSAGKPRLAGNFPLRFNLAHTGSVVVLATTHDAEIGIDVEDTSRSLRSLEQIAQYAFAPPEVEELQRVSGDLRREVFFRTWTLKEAYIKATGDGLGANLRAFWFAANDEDATIQFEGGADHSSSGWRFQHGALRDRYRYALAVQTGRGIKVEWMDASGMVAQEREWA